MFASPGPFQLDGHARYSVSNSVLTCSWRRIGSSYGYSMTIKESFLEEECWGMHYIHLQSPPPVFYSFPVLPLQFASLVYLVRASFRLLWGDKAFTVHHVVCYLHPYKCSLGKLDIDSSRYFMTAFPCTHDDKNIFWKENVEKSFPIFKEHLLCWAEGTLIALKWGLLLQWIPSCTDGSFLHIDRPLWDLAVVVLAFYHILFRGQFITILWCLVQWGDNFALYGWNALP